MMIDYSRHLEDVANKIQQCLFVIIEELLIRNKRTALQDTAGLFYLWEDYKHLENISKNDSGGGQTTLKIETDAFHKRVECLLKILNRLESFGFYIKNVSELKKKLFDLQKQINEAGNISSGGRFEWVDSILVKCVREGNWLLVENVNLCSPAILDRLNSLLEPNGVLTLGEKGVDEDGNLVSIKPHPNFRLFFTMDPSHGEISRAMRNRGVEIALLDSDITGNNYLDLLSLLHSYGIYPYGLKKALFRAHKMIQTVYTDAGSFELLSFSLIQRACYFISRRLIHGCGYHEAFAETLKDVYLKSKFISLDEKFDVVSHVNDIITNVSGSLVSILLRDHDSLLPSCNTINTLHAQSNSPLHIVRKESNIVMLFLFLANQAFKRSSSSSTPCIKATLRITENDPKYLKLNLRITLYSCLHCFYSSASKRDAVLRHNWLQSFINNYSNNNCNIPNSLLTELEELSSMFYNTVVHYSILPDHFKNKLPDREELPWNFLNLYKISISPSMEEYANLFRNTEVLMIYELIKKREPLRELKIFSSKMATSMPVTLKNFKRIKEDLILGNIFLDPAIEMYSTILFHAEMLISSLRDSQYQFTSSQLKVILTGLIFFKRFQDVADINLINNDANGSGNISPNLLRYIFIHYHWLFKRTVSMLILLHDDHRFKPNKQESMNRLLHAVSVVSNSASFENYGIISLANKMRKRLHYPCAKSRKLCSESYPKLNSYWEFNETYENSIQAHVAISNKVTSYFLSESVSIRNKMISLYHKFWSSVHILDPKYAKNKNTTVVDSETSCRDHGKVSAFAKEYPVELISIFGIFCHKIEPLLRLRLYDELTDTSLFHHNEQFEDVLINGLPSLMKILTFKSPYYTALFESFYAGNIAKYRLQMLFMTELIKQIQMTPYVSPIATFYIDKDSDPYLLTYSAKPPSCQGNLLPFHCPLFCININGQFLIRSELCSGSVLVSPTLQRYEVHNQMLDQIKEMLFWYSSILSHRILSYRENEATMVQIHFYYVIQALNSSIVPKWNPYKKKFPVTKKCIADNDINCIMRQLLAFAKRKSSFGNTKMESSNPTISNMQYICDLITDVSVHLENMHRYESKNNLNNTWMEIGQSWATLGLIQYFVFSTLPYQDPVIKNKYKMENFSEEIIHWNHFLFVEKLQSDITGEDRYLQFVQVIANYKRELERKHDIKSRNIDKDRLMDDSYDSLLKEIDRFKSVLITDTFYDIMDDLQAVFHLLMGPFHDYIVENLTKIFDTVDVWVSSIDRFINDKLMPYCYLYNDVVMPVIYSIFQMSYGIRIMRSVIQKAACQWMVSAVHLKNNPVVTIDVVLTKLIHFPILDIRFALEFILEEINFCEILSDLVLKENTDKQRMSEFYCHTRLIRSTLKETCNVFSALHIGDRRRRKWLSKNCNDLIFHALNLWLLHEMAEDEQELSKNSLYVRITDYPSDEVTDKFKDELFPSTANSDFEGINISENEHVDHSPNGEDDSSMRELLAFKFSADDIEYLYKTHRDLSFAFAYSHWLPLHKFMFSAQNVEENIRDSFSDRYCIFDTILRMYYPAVKESTDMKLFPSLILIADILKVSKETETSNDIYDFYQSPNISNAMDFLPLLKKIKAKSETLLNEWENHITLKQTVVIVERILNFEVNSPLSRFLEGAEILLKQLHEWEEIAHNKISFSELYEELTVLIFDWHKLEISHWNKLLPVVIQRMNKKSYKWWFHLDFLCTRFLDQSCNYSGISSVEFINAIKQFIETSDLASFNLRLEMLETFHRHLVITRNSELHDTLCYILWNIHSFYSIFSTHINKYHEKLIEPVRKKINDFVKIIRWNDINYWSIKETVNKIRNTFVKHVKEFEKLSRTQVSTALSQVSISDFVVDTYVNQEEQLSDSVHNIYLAKDDLFNEILPMFNDPKFMKSRKFCSSIMSVVDYSEIFSDILQYTCDTKKSIEELNKLEIDAKLSKDKQKSQAKNILQRKKRVISDLFKSLSEYGFSFKAGLTKNQDVEYATDFAYLKPVDVENAFKYYFGLRPEDEELIKSLSGCDKNYYISTALHTRLKNILQQPHKDIGPMMIDRLKGFTNELTKIVFDQNHSLHVDIYSFYQLRVLENFLDEMLNSPINNFQERMISCKEKFISALSDVIYFLHQFSVLINSYPESVTSDGSTLSMPIFKFETHPESILYKYQNSPEWENVRIRISNLLQTAKDLQLRFSHFDFAVSVICDNLPISSENNFFSYFVTSTQFSILKNERHKLKLLIDDMNFVKLSLVIKDEYDESPLCDGLSEHIEVLSVLSEDVEYLFSLLEPEDTENILSSLDDPLVRSQIADVQRQILLIIEHLYKKYVLCNGTYEKPKKLKGGLINSLSADLDSLKVGIICGNVVNILENVWSFTASKLLWSKEMLKPLRCLINQYRLLMQYILTQKAYSLQVSGNLCTSLLVIFADLATQGFNIPEELMDGEEGGKNSKDGKGGMGLSDGEGVKDVSDEIESQDQLEDARLPGKEEEQSDNKPIAEEEKGIEMTEDFGGVSHEMNDDNEDENEEQNDDDEIDKEMGETGTEDDTLDEKVWGSDTEEVDETDDSKKMDEGDGPGENTGDIQYGAKDNETSETAEDEGKDVNDKNKKDEINEMDEGEVNQDQIDPYYGNMEPYPEPEPLDLPEELELDATEGKGDDKTNDENPFDIDSMKENIPDDEKPGREEEMKTEEQNEVKSPPEPDEDDDMPGKNKGDEKNDGNDEDDKVEQDDTNDDGGKKDEEKTGEEPKDDNKTTSEDCEPNASDDKPTKDEAESADYKNGGSKDVVSENFMEQEDMKDKPSQEENNSRTSKLEETFGQAEQGDNKDKGHNTNENKGSRTEKDGNKREKRKMEPGEKDVNRALADVKEQCNKRMKTLDTKEADNEEGNDEVEGGEHEDKNTEADLYQHIRESEEAASEILDAATKEQAEKQILPNKEDEKAEKLAEDEKMDLDESEPESDPEKLEESKPQSLKTKSSKSGNDEEKSNMEETINCEVEMEIPQIEVEGEFVPTMTVGRGPDTTFHTRSIDELNAPLLDTVDVESLKMLVHQQLSSWHQAPTSQEAARTWRMVSLATEHLSQELSEQLRLVLEPTQASRLKGDFRTGRRINMRKVIPYIASEFRKDRIWLRRTKPSKREYQIILAIDNSSSMSDNHSKQLAFESVALVSKALSMIESGQLGVVSFGSTAHIVHALSQPFTDESGARIMQEFGFDEQHTHVACAMSIATGMFVNESKRVNFSEKPAQLLIIISDGRGITSEGSEVVYKTIRNAKQLNIFTVFIIADSPQMKDSILDIREAVFKDDKFVGLQPYMDSFPFPFYLILRDINKLPAVLSDALRQWFELIADSSSF